MPNEVGSIWENRTHPGHYMLVTAKKREENKRYYERYYYSFYYLDEPEVTLLIDMDQIDKVFKKVS